MLCKLLQRFYKAVRRLVENHGAGFPGKLLQMRLAAFFLREEALKAESVTRQAGGHDSRNASGWARKSLDLYSLLRTGAGKKKAGVRYPRGTRVRHQGHIEPAKDAVPDCRGRAVLIILMVALELAFNGVMLQENRACAGIFSQNEVRLLEHINGTDSHVFKIANGRWDYVKFSSHCYSFFRQMTIFVQSVQCQPNKVTEMFLENAKKTGCIEVICGSMFSGKTEELIRRLKRAQFAKQKIATFKPTIDKRYSDLDVVSHDSHSISCTPIKSPARMLQIDSDVQVVGIDEAQFFDESIVEVCQTLANRGVRVIIAGLDTDYLGKPFGPMPGLMAIAEDVQKVHAICVRCGSLANHSHRLSASKKLVVLGEKDTYEPLCRECYIKALAEDNA